MSSFKEFIRRYNDGTITEDAAWRAYDIEGMATDDHAWCALPLVNMGAGKRKDNAYAAVGAWFGIGSAERAKMLLAYWYVWRTIALGDRRRAVLRSEVDSPDPAGPWPHGTDTDARPPTSHPRPT